MSLLAPRWHWVVMPRATDGKRWGTRHMVVLRYTLDCGSLLELIVPAGQVRDGHVLGRLRVWCHPCSRIHGAAGVRMVAPGPG